MRVSVAGLNGSELPFTAKILIDALKNHCESKGLINLKFKIGGLPKSLNKMYERGMGSSFCKPGEPGAFQDKNGRWRKKNSQATNRLSKDVIEYRLLVANQMGQDRWKWNPKGVTAAIALFESPYWLDGFRRVSKKDVDNRIKVLLDAIEISTETPDELHWEVHMYKLLSKNHRTTVYLFDLGDIVEYHF